MKITLRLDKRYRLANGKYPVKLAVARGGKTLYVPLNLSVDEADWDADSVNHIRNIPQKKALNTYLNGQLSQAELSVQDLQSKGLLRTLTDRELIDYLSIDKRRIHGKENALFKFHADKMIASQPNPNTRNTYEVAVKAMQDFCNYDTLLLSDITKPWVENFMDYLRKKNLTQGTIGAYITKIRTIYKRAADEGFTDQRFPMVSIKHKETRKRSMMIENIRTLARGTFPAVQQKYVDLFLLVLMMRGINTKDLSRLPADAIHNGRVEYDRSKTGKHYDIKIEPEMLEIIRRYQGREHLLSFFDRHKDAYYRYFGNIMSYSLRNAAKSVGIDEKLSPYYARHSWATLAIEIGASMELVSAGLGHKIGAPITQIYVAFNQKQVDELARRVIDYIYEKGEFKKKK